MKSPNGMTIAWALVMVTGALALSACGQPRSRAASCATSLECNSGEICDNGLCIANPNGPGAPQSCDDGSEGCVCNDDIPCQPAFACNAGRCEPREGARQETACTRHNDCPASQYCKLATGACVECLNADHCPVGEVCRSNGTCGQDEACTSHEDCAPAGLVCEPQSGACVQCNLETDCPYGQTCRNNSCVVPGGGAPPCQSQVDCDAYGKVCDTGAGECRDCTSDTQCGDGMRCSAGTCTQSTTGGGGGGGGTTYCSSQSDCPNGLSCNFIFGECEPCLSDFQCEAPTICDPFQGKCVASECSGNADCQEHMICSYGSYGRCDYCFEDDECDAGEICQGAGTWIGGDCVAAPPPPECQSSNDCSGGKVCKNSTCVSCSSNNDCAYKQDHACVSGSCQPLAGFGGTCSSDGDCDSGFFCLGGQSGGFCTRTCIGSGKSDSVDCPWKWGCINFESGALDGAKACVPTREVASDYPGAPFTLKPGAACTAETNACQTSICRGSKCQRDCVANRDCNSGEVCWGEWYQPTETTVAMSGNHYCEVSDTSNYTAANQACNDGFGCDSGLCLGVCDDNSSICNSSADCAGNCVGSCRNHCRTTSDCGSSQVCAPWPTYHDGTKWAGWVPSCMALSTVGTGTVGSTCTADSNCRSDWCIGGTCTEPCGVSADCSSGRTCQVLPFIDGNNTTLYSMAFCMP